MDIFVKEDETKGVALKCDAHFNTFHDIVTQGTESSLRLVPGRGWDVGAGPGQELTCQVTGGVAGVIMDTRGRPLLFPQHEIERQSRVASWNESLSLYPPTAH